MRSLLVMFAILLLVLTIISSFGGSLSSKETFVDDTDEYAEEFYQDETYPPANATENSTAPSATPSTPVYDPYQGMEQKQTPPTSAPTTQPSTEESKEYVKQSNGVVEPFEDGKENNYGPF